MLMPGKATVEQRFGSFGGVRAPGGGVSSVAPGIEALLLHQVAIFVGNGVPGA